MVNELHGFQLKNCWILRRSFPGLICGCGNDQNTDDDSTWVMSKSRYFNVMNPEHHADFCPVLDDFYCPVCLSTWGFNDLLVVKNNDPQIIEKCRAKVKHGRRALIRARTNKEIKKMRKERESKRWELK